MAKKGETVKHDPVNVEVREGRGSRKAQELRANGKIPAIVYGMKKDIVKIALPGALAETIIHSGTHTMQIVLNGKNETVLIQDVQYDYLNRDIEHVDLMRVDPNQKVSVSVPLEFRGTAKGTKEGGILETQLTELELEVRALEIPDVIRVNVEGLELHQAIHAREVALPAGAKLLNPPEVIVCQVRTVREEAAAGEVETGPAEPEVIGKKKEEEGAEGAAPAGKAAGGGAKASGGPAKK